jgi:hypothetical protein
MHLHQLESDHDRSEGEDSVGSANKGEKKKKLRTDRRIGEASCLCSDRSPPIRAPAEHVFYTGCPFSTFCPKTGEIKVVSW